MEGPGTGAAGRAAVMRILDTGPCRLFGLKYLFGMNIYDSGTSA